MILPKIHTRSGRPICADIYDLANDMPENSNQDSAVENTIIISNNCTANQISHKESDLKLRQDHSILNLQDNLNSPGI